MKLGVHKDSKVTNASFLLVEIWQDLLENDFEDNDRDFGCGKMLIGPNLGQKGEKESENVTFGHIMQMLHFFWSKFGKIF